MVDQIEQENKKLSKQIRRRFGTFLFNIISYQIGRSSQIKELVNTIIVKL